MVNVLQRLILVDEDSKSQLSDIVAKIKICQGQAQHSGESAGGAFSEWSRAGA